MRLEARFVRIDAAWPPAEALEALALPRLERAVVHRLLPDGSEYFYAYDVDQLTARLAASSAANVTDALNLHEYQASPTAAAATGAAPGTVVVADGQIAGVVTSAVGGTRSPDLLGPTDLRGLRGSLASEIVVGDETSLIVEILRDASAATTTFAARTGDELDIVVQVGGGLALAGKDTAKVTLTDADLAQQFKVRGARAGEGTAKVMVFKGGVGIASLALTVQVVAASTSTQVTQASAPIHPPVSAPDLSIVVLQTAPDEYKMMVSSRDPALGYNFEPFGPIKLPDDAETYFATFFDDIDGILTGGDPPKAKDDAFNAKGTALTTKIMPDGLRQALWSLRGKIETILIQSEEPWVPWEVCRLFGDDNGRIVEDGFLAERFTVTRWFLRTPLQTDLHLAKLALVVPTDSNLLAASAEARYMKMLDHPPDRSVTPIKATSVDVRDALADGAYDALHFTGHGLANTGNADRANIRLDQNRWFTPGDVCGRVANFGARHPFVMLNACQVGRAGKSLGGVAGWPQAFIRSGAAAFVGAFWSIGDGRASVFAQELYAQLLAGHPISAAVQQARAQIRNAMDPTWLAYVVYAHPDAKLVGASAVAKP